MSSLGGVLGFPLGGDPPSSAPKVKFDSVPGADISLIRIAQTGKFDIQWDATGNPVFVDDQSHAVLSLLYEHKGEYWADITRARGSLLWTVKDIKKTTPSKVKAFAEDALQPLVDAGKIIAPQVSAGRDGLNINRINLSISYSLPGGGTVTLRPAIGY